MIEFCPGGAVDAIMLGECPLTQCSGAGVGLRALVQDWCSALPCPSSSCGLFEYFYALSPFGNGVGFLEGMQGAR